MPALELPTAVQALAEVHDTPDSPVLDAPVGVGVGWIDQLDPSHRSATVPALELPTAVQALADVHDTANSAAAGVGVGWIDQLDPFQTSARVRCVFELSK